MAHKYLLFIKHSYILKDICSSDTCLSVRTHVCGSRHPTADLRQRIFPSFSFMFGCLHVSDSDLRHPTSDVRQRFFRSGTEKIGWQVTLDECLQNNGKVETKFAVANRPSDVVSRIHVYVDQYTDVNNQYM